MCAYAWQCEVGNVELHPELPGWVAGMDLTRSSPVNYGNVSAYPIQGQVGGSGCIESGWIRLKLRYLRLDDSKWNNSPKKISCPSHS